MGVAARSARWMKQASCWERKKWNSPAHPRGERPRTNAIWKGPLQGGEWGCRPTERIEPAPVSEGVAKKTVWRGMPGASRPTAAGCLICPGDRQITRSKEMAAPNAFWNDVLDLIRPSGGGTRENRRPLTYNPSNGIAFPTSHDERSRPAFPRRTRSIAGTILPTVDEFKEEDGVKCAISSPEAFEATLDRNKIVRFQEINALLSVFPAKSADIHG